MMYLRRILKLDFGVFSIVPREFCSVLSSYAISRAVGLVFIKLALRCTASGDCRP